MMSEDNEHYIEEFASPHHHAVSHDLCGPRRRWLAAAVGLLVLIVVIIISVVATSGKRAPYVPYATVQPEEQELYTMVTEALNKEGVPTNDFLIKEGHQYKAFNWLSKSQNLQSMSRTTKLQRYALACLYFATNNVPHSYAPTPGPWTSETLWLSDESECDWAHVHCDPENKTQKLIFQNNNLSGKLPLDLALIREPLHMLDLTSNRIHMKGNDFGVFDYMHRLKHLDLEDNFIESSNGLPQNLKACTDLEEFKASYNLLGGELDNGVLESLQKLTHLEIESCFFIGALPFLGQMPNLVYIYLRRNDLTSHLNFLKNPLPNLFSLWLDGNDFTETIPTQVGHLTSLASFSVTNSSLTGTIPTEFGALPMLNRIWLYGNKLNGTVPMELSNLTALQILEIQNNNITGEIPKGVCETIKASDYANKALVVDCDKVKCNDCCTKCA